MQANDLVGWVFSCPKLTYPKINLLGPAQWVGQIMGKVCDWNSKDVKSSELRELVPAVNMLNIWTLLSLTQTRVSYPSILLLKITVH